MFSPDREYQPYFTLDHIKVDNIHFVTNLRKNPNYDGKRKNEYNHMKSNGNAPVNNSNKTIDSHDSNNEQGVESNKVITLHPMKDSNCRNLQCIHNNERLRDEHHLVSINSCIFILNCLLFLHSLIQGTERPYVDSHYYCVYYITGSRPTVST